ncbi:MAG: DUF952 domain-containing protein [Nocardioides sp.]|nr:DUF952 domain-containing protein [Nocardioides sp.]
MTIFHIATAADWERARADGSYTTSTLGVSLEQQGFIHASRAEQWPDVRDRIYAGCTEPLVLLEIEPAQLGCPVVEEVAAPGTTETFPHVYGPLPPAAVLAVTPLT